MEYIKQRHSIHTKWSFLHNAKQTLYRGCKRHSPSSPRPAMSDSGKSTGSNPHGRAFSLSSYFLQYGGSTTTLPVTCKM